MAIQSKALLAPPELSETWQDLYARAAAQQPSWGDGPGLTAPAAATALTEIRHRLAQEPPLVDPGDIDMLRVLLADVAAGEMQIVQAGDCAEDPEHHTPAHLSRKVGLLDALAGVMRVNTGRPVLRVGRIAGQFAKPRSRPTELVNGQELTSYRGPLVNRPDPDPEARRPDPYLLLSCHRAAAAMMRYLNGTGEWTSGPLVWTSHEALLLDYELPQLRRFDDGRLFLTSAHWPWIGERTRQPHGAHVALLAMVSNPVACKLGPGTTADELLGVCEQLDPGREPGRLTLIPRMGAAIARTLPRLLEAVRQAGHPAIWLCDPMHANTVTAPCSRKTRLMDAILGEIAEFQQIVAAGGGVAGGLHLEATPDPVTECVTDEAELGGVGRTYTTLCDPRLNPQQALAAAAAWTASAP